MTRIHFRKSVWYMFNLGVILIYPEIVERSKIYDDLLWTCSIPNYSCMYFWVDCRAGNNISTGRIQVKAQTGETLPGQDRGTPTPKERRVSTCYTEGGATIAITQEDFPVHYSFSAKYENYRRNSEKSLLCDTHSYSLARTRDPRSSMSLCETSTSSSRRDPKSWNTRVRRTLIIIRIKKCNLLLFGYEVSTNIFSSLWIQP